MNLDKQKKIRLLIIIGSIILIIFITLNIIERKQKYDEIEQLKKDFKIETSYCDKDKSTAKLNSIDYTTVKVKIESIHNDTSSYPNINNFVNEVCELRKNSYIDLKENQIDFNFNCGKTKDTISYTYVGSMKNAMKQLIDDGYSCYTIKKDNNILLDKLKSTKWCNYYATRYYFTFDDMAHQSYGGIINHDMEYSVIDNKVIIYASTYNRKYEYNSQNNILIDTGKNNNKEYLFACENEEEDYSLVSGYYHYDESKYFFAPIQLKNYKVTDIKCSNGITAYFDEERSLLFPSENKRAECHIYFDKIV